jgi:hypothetical protein
MIRRIPAFLALALLLAMPAAAVAGHHQPDPAAATWWAQLAAQVRSLVTPAMTPHREPSPHATAPGRGHRLIPSCSSGMDPNGHCL